MITIKQREDKTWEWTIEGIGFRYSGTSLHYITAATNAYHAWEIVKREEKKLAMDALKQVGYKEGKS